MRLLALLALCVSPVLAEGVVKGERIEVELVAEHTSVRPGSTITVGLRVKPDAHWHVYWKNPGDAGLEPELVWTLPDGVEAGPIEWPFPKAFVMPGPVMNYVLEGEVVLPVTIRVPAGVQGPLKLVAKSQWLVCDDKQCVPGEAKLELSLDVGENAPAADARWAKLFESARQNRPKPTPEGSLKVSRDGDDLLLRLVREKAGKAYFFPYRDQLKYSEAQVLADGVLTLATAKPLSRLRGVLVLDGARAYEVDLAVEASVSSPAISIGIIVATVAILVVLGVVLVLRRP